MSNILLKVENAGAERLWNYIMAYRRMIKENHKETTPGTNITLGMLPELEIRASKPKRNHKKP